MPVLRWSQMGIRSTHAAVGREVRSTGTEIRATQFNWRSEMKAKRNKPTRRIAMVRGLSPIKSFTLEDIRLIVREEITAAISSPAGDGWLPIADAPRDQWLLVSAGGPVTSCGGFGWQIGQVTDQSVRGTPPWATCWGGGSYMGVKWYMELPPLRMNRE
jgi:hypothetical protein